MVSVIVMIAANQLRILILGYAGKVYFLSFSCARRKFQILQVISSVNSHSTKNLQE
jgi:hypothetical protein